MRSRFAAFALMIPTAMLIAQPALPCMDFNWPYVPGDLLVSAGPAGASSLAPGRTPAALVNTIVIRCATTVPMGALTYCCTGLGFPKPLPSGFTVTGAKVYDVSGIVDSTVALMSFSPNATSSASFDALAPGKTLNWSAMHAQVPAGGITGGRSGKVVFTFTSPGGMSNLQAAILLGEATVANAAADAGGNVTAFHALARLGRVSINGVQIVPMTSAKALAGLTLLLLSAGALMISRRRSPQAA